MEPKQSGYDFLNITIKIIIISTKGCVNVKDSLFGNGNKINRLSGKNRIS